MKASVKELIKYVFWGGISTSINLMIFYLFLALKMQYIFANVFSYIIAVLFSYVFNKLFVFKDTNSGKVKTGIKYFAIRGVSIFIDSGLLMFLCEVCGINVAVSKIIDSILIIGSTYLVNKFFVFKK